MSKSRYILKLDDQTVQRFLSKTAEVETSTDPRPPNKILKDSGRAPNMEQASSPMNPAQNLAAKNKEQNETIIETAPLSQVAKGGTPNSSTGDDSFSETHVAKDGFQSSYVEPSKKKPAEAAQIPNSADPNWKAMVLAGIGNMHTQGFESHSKIK